MFLLLIVGACVAASELNDDEAKKAVRMKTSRQLREILDELDIHAPAGASKDELRDIALKENAIPRWEELHPEKKRATRPDGMDADEWQRLKAQMKGDFSHEQDPEKRRILEKLKAKGISFGGASSLDVEQLKNLEAAMDGMGSGTFKMPGDFRTPGGGPADEGQKQEL